MSHVTIGVSERPPLGKWIPLSFQHVFAMFGATVLVPMLTGLSRPRRSLLPVPVRSFISPLPVQRCPRFGIIVCLHSGDNRCKLRVRDGICPWRCGSCRSFLYTGCPAGPAGGNEMARPGASSGGYRFGHHRYRFEPCPDCHGYGDE